MNKNNEIPILYTQKENCSGCTACYAICPQNIIEMTADEEGFEYPRIIKPEKCLKCHRCLAICPIRKASNEY